MAGADLVIGAVLVPGGRAPVVATEDMVRAMQPGTVIVDVAVDQGGCIETTVETTHEHPVVERYGVLHYGVGNIPAAVPHTSTYALTNATFPYALAVADRGALGAAGADRALAEGVVTAAGSLTNPAVAEALGKPAVSPSKPWGTDAGTGASWTAPAHGVPEGVIEESRSPANATASGSAPGMWTTNPCTPAASSAVAGSRPRRDGPPPPAPATAHRGRPSAWSAAARRCSISSDDGR